MASPDHGGFFSRAEVERAGRGRGSEHTQKCPGRELFEELESKNDTPRPQHSVA